MKADKELDGGFRALHKQRLLSAMNPFLRILLLFAVALMAGALPSNTMGQNPQDQAQLIRDQPNANGPQVSVNGVEGDHAVASPNDPDLGVQQILKHRDEYQPFSITLSTPIYYTSNVALANSGEMSDLIVAPAVGAYYDPRFTKTFYGHVGVREQLFYYNDNPVFDFGSFDVEAGFSYYLPQFYNLVLRAMYDYNRLTTKDTFNAFFENHSIIVNAELPFRFGRAQRLAIGVDANVSMTGEPDGPRRHDFDVYVGYGVNLTRALTLDVVGRVVTRDYVLTDRVDVSGILALSATYRLTPWWSASAISSFARNRSNHSVFDYDVVNAGGAMSFNVKF
jgi:hypothetical protein